MIFLLGATGYVGQAFENLLRGESIDFRSLSRRDADYTQRAVFRRLVHDQSPDFVINAAGYTGKPNVDACETDRARCLAGNAVLPGMVREVCEEAGVPWGHVSSGCIFSGRRPDGGGFREDDAPNFCFRTNHCSFYSGTKALGEEALGYRETNRADRIPGWEYGFGGSPGGYVWRLRIPFDHRDGARNYLSKLLRYERLLDAENAISHLGEFVQACFETFRKRVPYGIYNVTNPGSVTARQVTTWMKEEHDRRVVAGMESPFGKEFDFFSSEDEFMQRAARTPRSNCVLDSARLAAAGIHLRPVEEAVRTALREWEPEAGDAP